MTELNPNIMWLALSKVPKLGPVSLRQLIGQYQSVIEVWQAVSLSLEQKEQLIKQAHQEYSALQEKGIKILNIHDPQYPSSLKQNKEIAPLLYYKGHIAVLKNPMVAIVGSRNANDYGSDTTK
jgi:DNA processing protein